MHHRDRAAVCSRGHNTCVEIGLGVDQRLGMSVAQLRDLAGDARTLGYESLWTNSSLDYDPIALCVAWHAESALRTGISVVPLARGPAEVIGLAARTAHELTAGTFTLGIGAGSVTEEPIAAVRGYIAGIRKVARDVPMIVGALGPQMLRLAGETADGALLNWATPERIAASRVRIDEGAARAGRDPGSVPISMYIRVCVDDDADAARRAFGAQVLGYAMGRPGVPNTAGYRGLFAQMGFDAELTELEQRRDRGAAMSELVAATPDEMLHAVGYYGPAATAPAAFARLSAGLDEAMVRIITARPGLEPVVETMAALTPALIRSAH